MAHQTEYPDRMAAGFPGMLSDTGFFDNDSMTLVAGTDPVVVVGYGVPVTYGATDRTCVPVSTGDTAADIAGFAVRTQGGNAETNANNGYVNGDTVSVMKKGRMYVTASVAVVAGDPVTVDVATGAISNTGGVTIPGAVFEKGAAANGLAVIRIK